MRNTKVLLRYLYRQEWKTKFVTLDEVARWTRDGKYAQRVNAARGMGAVPTEIGIASGPVAASWLPAVMPARGAGPVGSGPLPTGGDHQGVYTGLVLLSLPITGGRDATEQLRRQVNLWPQTLMSFVGATAQTLYVIIPYRQAEGGLPVDDAQVALFQQYAYRRAADYAMNATGIRPEEVAHDGSELFRLSFDPDVFLNPAVKPILMQQPVEPLTDDTAPAVRQAGDLSLDTQLLPGYTRREMDLLKFNAICRQLSVRRQQQPEDYLIMLAANCCKAGIDQELATKMTLDVLQCFDKEILVRTTFLTAYEKHKMGRQNPIEKTMMHQLRLEDFLKRRYMFRRNKVTGEVEVQEKHKYQLEWKPLTQEVHNDINNAAIREGIRVWPKDLDRILVSEHTDSYDPVDEWLQQLPKWDGRDRLGEMADRVKSTNPWWRDDFKIWMRSMVNQWRSGLNGMYGAQMVLMLVGGQGTRKSTFMRMLLPREMMAYYIDRIDFANKKEALRALSRFLLINIDEYDQMSKAQTAFLKHLIQRTDVKERKLYSTAFEQQQRYAAFCATTNSLVPLKDETGSRRYLVAEVSGVIDTNTTGDRRIDYRQLYAQIVEEIERGEECAFTGERERRIVEQNAEYYDVPSVVSLFEDRFRKPAVGDVQLLLSPTELLAELKMDVKNRSNATLLGNYLRRNGYEKGEGRERRRYKVARCSGNK